MMISNFDIFKSVMAMAFALAFIVTPTGAWAARLYAVIDISDQRMGVLLDGVQLHYWKTSTARSGYRTPLGTFRPKRLERMWYSTKYDNAPMPYSVFFYGGYAIHGTDDLKNLGRPASHGCVRLHPDNAEILFNLIRKIGISGTRIVVQK